MDIFAERNRMLADELPRPISMGTGIHAGKAILGELGYRERFLLTAIGDAAHVAARLQELTKEYGCRAVVSEFAGESAGAALLGLSHHQDLARARIPERRCAAYYPETYPLVPLYARDGRNHTPSSKAVPIRLVLPHPETARRLPIGRWDSPMDALSR
jgi:hypothetical protein